MPVVRIPVLSEPPWASIRRGEEPRARELDAMEAGEREKAIALDSEMEARLRQAEDAAFLFGAPSS